MSKHNLEQFKLEHEQTLARVNALVVQTKARYEACPREIDSMSKSANLAHRIRYNQLSREYNVAVGAAPDLERYQAHLRSIVYSHALLSELREKYVAELLALPSLATERDAKQDARFTMFTTAIRQIDRGVEYMDGMSRLASCLYEDLTARITPTWKGSRDPWDYLYGSLADTEARMAEVEQRIAGILAKVAKVEQAIAADEAAATPTTTDEHADGGVPALTV